MPRMRRGLESTKGSVAEVHAKNTMSLVLSMFMFRQSVYTTAGGQKVLAEIAAHERHSLWKHKPYPYSAIQLSWVALMLTKP